MRVLAVSSMHAASTRDVWKGVLKGFAANGQSVQSYDALGRAEFFANYTAYINSLMDGSMQGDSANGHTRKPLQLPNVRRLPSPQLLTYEPVFLAAHHFEVDLVYVVSPQYFPLDIAQMLRKDGFKVWAHFTECPYEDAIDAPEKAPAFDACFVNDLNSLPAFRAFNPNTFYFPHSYDPDRHFPAWDVPKTRRPRKTDINEHQHVVYVGTGMVARQRYLEEVNWDGIDLRLFGHWPFSRPAESGDEDLFASLDADIRPMAASSLVPYIRYNEHAGHLLSMLDNAFTARVYRGAAIGINMHRTERWANTLREVVDDGEAYSMGPRAVELAACGTFQISDHRQEIVDVFGDTVPIHESPAHLEQLIRQYLAEPELRREMAVKQNAAVKDRTFANHMRLALEAAA